MATDIQTETLRQFNALAPSVFVFGGKPYARSPLTLTDGDTKIRVAFNARKRRGDLIASKIDVAIDYSTGSDLYQIAIVHVDGATLDPRAIASLTGATWESFADLARIVAMCGE